MKSDLLLFGFDHAIRFDVIVTLVFFNNLRLNTEPGKGHAIFVY